MYIKKLKKAKLKKRTKNRAAIRWFHKAVKQLKRNRFYQKIEIAKVYEK